MLLNIKKKPPKTHVVCFFNINTKKKLVFFLRLWSAVLMNQLMTFALLANILMWLGVCLNRRPTNPWRGRTWDVPGIIVDKWLGFPMDCNNLWINGMYYGINPCQREGFSGGGRVFLEHVSQLQKKIGGIRGCKSNKSRCFVLEWRFGFLGLWRWGGIMVFNQILGLKAEHIVFNAKDPWDDCIYAYMNTWIFMVNS